jgi:threonine-phosphate decarboxylase
MTDFPIHGGQLREISERFNVPASELLDFSANINPEGPSPAVLAALRASLDSPSTLTQYPDLQEVELKQSIARYAAVAPHNVAVANGFVPLLEAALRALHIHNCLLPVPAFNEYRRTLERIGVSIAPHVLRPETNFSYDIDAMLATRPGAILLANPQNPSGVLCDRAMMLNLVIKAAAQQTYVLLDEAFIDYEPQHSLTSNVERFPNLVVFRSVTKFHGIPGLRVAYAVAGSQLVQTIDASLAPWPITTLAAHGVIAALEDEPYALRARSLNLACRTELKSALGALGFPTYPSVANFLLLRLSSDRDAIALWKFLIVKHSILLRSCENYEGLPAGHLRIAVRDEKMNQRLIEALRVL